MINNLPNVSFGHIYSNALDSVLRNNGRLNRKQEAKLYDAVSRAAQLNKSVITASTSKGLVLLTSGETGHREIYSTYHLRSDAKTNIEQLESVVKDAEALEKKDLPVINPLKKGASVESSIGRPDNRSCNLQYIYNKTYNGYNTSF